jgi:mannose-6-phosphate isomerase
MQRIHGVAQHYAWGDPTAIPAALELPPDGRPWAEWWLGTHPGAPSTLDDGSPLTAVAGELPFLLKLLAAAEPLSLQTHPDAATARAGWAQENHQGIAIDDPARIYRDPHAKPELLCAITPFDALSGFRPQEATVALLDRLGADDLSAHLRANGLEATVRSLYEGGFDPATTLQACDGANGPEAELVRQLASRYPGDASVAVTLLLHRMSLQPGEALFLGPGNLHAYLHGLGVEVMGASDNVVRGGLTSKHVDVPELLRVLRYEPLDDPVVRPVERDGAWCYPTPDAPFELCRYDVERETSFTTVTGELVLCTDGDASVLRQGEAGYVPQGETVTFTGPSTVYRVTGG